MDENVGVIDRNKLGNRLIGLLLVLARYIPIALHFLAVNFLIVLFLIYLNENKALLKMIYSQ
jgi:hypothetical protein